MTYPTPAEHGDWKAAAEAMDMSLSEWIQAMVRAGRKNFDATVEPDESTRELREQRNDLKEELERARDRITTLERQLYRGERQEIRDFVQDNPGATYGEIQQRVVDTVPGRVDRLLDELEGGALDVDGDGYYPMEES
jgi:predicted nuclease with TOPRIM domain